MAMARATPEFQKDEFLKEAVIRIILRNMEPIPQIEVLDVFWSVARQQSDR